MSSDSSEKDFRTCTWDCIHPGWIGPASPKEKHGEATSPGVVELIGFAAQAKHVQFESAGVPALNTLNFGFN